MNTLEENIEIAHQMLVDLSSHIGDEEQVEADLEAIIIHLKATKKERERY